MKCPREYNEKGLRGGGCLPAQSMWDVEAVALLEENGKRYYIKLDTRPFLTGVSNE